ncbi:DUF2490 domain-containing protein [Qipengyuania sp. JC766]|uniref:DUF2490 domain-containing protein n=1 Tax=Qipengyuania sp. JC766 TaxID=3232139 RepID=UPI00345A7F80
MRRYTRSLLAGAAIAVAPASPALAQDEAFELWLNPSIGTDLDADTAVEIETAQRFRSEEDGRVDTYYVRAWLLQDIADNATLGGAVEYRINDGGSNEVRTIQQISASHGALKTRLRLEQRFVDDADQMGLRLRPRVGVGFDLSEDGRWSAGGDAELFWTLRGNNSGSDTGLTGLRMTLGVDYAVSENLSLGLSYLR